MGGSIRHRRCASDAADFLLWPLPDEDARFQSGVVIKTREPPKMIARQM